MSELLIFVSMPPGVEHCEREEHFAEGVALIFVSMPPGVEHATKLAGISVFGQLIFVSMPPGVEHPPTDSETTAPVAADLRLDASGR